MASKTSTKTDVAADLHEWVSKEMHFRPIGRHVNSTQIPTVEDFSQICKGQTKELWQFVVNNVYSAQTVRKVHGNLMLKQRQNLPHSHVYKVKYGSGEHYNQERAELTDKHRSLVADITSARAAVRHLEKDLSHTQTELAHVEKSYQESTNQICDIQRKAALLNAHSQHIEEEVDKLDEYKRRVLARVNKLEETAKKSTTDGAYYSRHGSSSSSDGNVLESACTKEVRECCESVGGFLHKLLQGTFGTDKVLMAQHKESLWRQVEDVLSNHSVSQLLHSLSINAQDTGFALRDRTANIDIKKDAASLRFKYERTGHLSDLSTPPSLLHSVHQLLEESQSLQIQSFLRTEQCRNMTYRLQSRLSQSQELLSDSMRLYYRDVDPGALQLAKTLMDTELQIVIHRAAIRVLDTTAASLKDKITLAVRGKEDLYAKYQKIQDFKKMVEGKQNLIRVLVKQNLNARSRLDTQRADIVQYKGRAFTGQDASTRSFATQLKDTVTQEVDAFAVLTLNNLKFIMLDSAYKIAVMDLSINRLSANQSTATGQMIQKLLHALEFPPYMAPEELLVKVVALQKEVVELETLLQTHTLLAESMMPGEQSEKGLVEHLSELCQEVTEHDRQQMDRILPVVQKRLLQATQALTDCLQAKDTVQAWWDQPGQSTTPWLTVDDNSLQQWKDKWTVTVTRLRQLQLGQQSQPS